MKRTWRSHDLLRWWPAHFLTYLQHLLSYLNHWKHQKKAQRSTVSWTFSLQLCTEIWRKYCYSHSWLSLLATLFLLSVRREERASLVIERVANAEQAKQQMCGTDDKTWERLQGFSDRTWQQHRCPPKPIIVDAFWDAKMPFHWTKHVTKWVDSMPPLLPL